jgi:hypothetical protein
MLPIPFNSAELATALPDVIAATGIAFVLAFVIFKPRSAPTPEAAIDCRPAERRQRLLATRAGCPPAAQRRHQRTLIF